MIYKDSYLARPPAVINPRQRLCLEAISFSLDSIEMEIQNVRAVAKRNHKVIPTYEDLFPPTTTDFSQKDKISLCNSLWSIVDQTHMLCRLLGELRLGSAPYVKHFLSKYAVAQRMRDKMDHIHSNLDNIIHAKKSRPSIFGSLSYFVCDVTARNDRGQWYGSAVMVHFGNLLKTKHNFPFVNPAGRQVTSGVSLFQFSAFDDTLFIDDLYKDILELAKNLEFTIMQSVTTDLERRKQNGIDITSLLAQPVSFISTAIVTLGEPSASGSSEPPANPPEKPPR